MGIFRSLRKNWKLVKLMKRLGVQRTPEQMLHMITSGHRSDDKAKAREELFELVFTDPDLCAIVDEYAATRGDIETIFDMLIRSGAGQWAGGAYVPAATVATNPTLDHALRRSRETLPEGWTERHRWMRLSSELVAYFQEGRVGAVA